MGDAGEEGFSDDDRPDFRMFQEVENFSFYCQGIQGDHDPSHFQDGIVSDNVRGAVGEE